MKILNFGSCNVDYVYSVEHIVNAGETISVDELNLFSGGKGLNQSIALARAGSTVYHAGYTGTDGEMLRDMLSESGVDISYLERADMKNGHAIIQVDSSGENCIFVYKGTNGIISREFIDSVLSNFDEGDIIVLQNEINNVVYLIEEAYKKKMVIVFNPSPFNDEIKNIDINHISYLILNETEAKGIAGVENANDFIDYARQNYPNLKVMLTLGKKGCIYADLTQQLSHGSFGVKAVDTTAAGDTFTGYFVSLVSQGKDMYETIKTASAASAVTVSRAGAAPSIPKMHEVEEALKTLKPYVGENIGKKESQIEKIYKYIDENLDKACLDDLANILGYSKSYLGARVTEILGDSFLHLLQKKRCERAAKLLADTDLSTSEIINKIGYENESFFRKKFKDIYGKSPLEYRKRK